MAKEKISENLVEEPLLREGANIQFSVSSMSPFTPTTSSAECRETHLEVEQRLRQQPFPALPESEMPKPAIFIHAKKCASLNCGPSTMESSLATGICKLLV